jgi:hypothetical protein
MEMRFFFYGTLLDDALRRIVIGREVTLSGAMLAGWRRLDIRGKHYPIISRDAGASVAGGLTEPLASTEIARLRYYEGDGYELITALVRDRDGTGVAAQIFVPPEGGLAGAGDWTLVDWQRDHRDAVLGRLRAYRWPEA